MRPVHGRVKDVRVNVVRGHREGRVVIEDLHAQPMNEITVTFLDVPSDFEALIGEELQLTDHLIFSHGVKWAKRLPGHVARLCGPG